MKSLMIMTAIALVSSLTFANAATVEGGAGTVSDITIKAKLVCDGPYVLTADAMAACQSGSFPTVLKDGTRFRNTGIGAEFNTLIRQLPVNAATAN